MRRGNKRSLCGVILVVKMTRQGSTTLFSRRNTPKALRHSVARETLPIGLRGAHAQSQKTVKSPRAAVSRLNHSKITKSRSTQPQLLLHFSKNGEISDLA
jgi:hypothetical protein